jgi:hypothetical protein
VTVTGVDEVKNVTYHNGHSCALYDCAKQQHTDGDLPSSSPPLYAASYDDHKGYQCAELDDDSERDQEADCPPHVAKGRVLCTVARSWEGNTCAFDR